MTSSTVSRESNPDLLAPRVHGVTSELHDRHLHRVAGPGRRLLEDQRRALAGERRAGGVDRRVAEVEDVADLVG